MIRGRRRGLEACSVVTPGSRDFRPMPPLSLPERTAERGDREKFVGRRSRRPINILLLSPLSVWYRRNGARAKDIGIERASGADRYGSE